jgi:DNA topoisomerase-2
MKHFHEDMVKLLSKRVVDMAAVLGPHVKVYLNNERIKVSSFNEYVKLYNIEKCA